MSFVSTWHDDGQRVSYHLNKNEQVSLVSSQQEQWMTVTIQLTENKIQSFPFHFDVFNEAVGCNRID